MEVKKSILRNDEKVFLKWRRLCHDQRQPEDFKAQNKQYEDTQMQGKG